MGYLDNAGLQHLCGKLKEKFAPKSHSHDDRYYTEAEMDGKLNSKVNNNEAGADSLLSKLTTSWTATPTDNTYFIRQDTGGGDSFGRVKFSTLWNYIKGKTDGVYQPKGNYAASGHTHDDRYYTEAEVDGKLNEKLHEASYQGDLNDLTTTGLYHLYGTNTNVPANGNATVYVDFNVGTPYQVWTYDMDGTTYRRTRSSGSWTGWTQLSFTDTKDWTSITGKPSTFPPEAHNHDDRYYTEAEMDGKLGSKVDNTEAGANGLINKLESGTAVPVDNDLIVTQWANHTTATAADQNRYVRRPMSSIWSYIKSKADSVYQPKGNYATTDTKNTAGSTNTTSKLYLIGATSQSTNPQTYSNASVYTTGGALAADGIGKDGYIAYPGGGFFTSHDSVVTGYCKIILPVGYTNTMMSFTVTIYDYVSNESVDYKISGYNYSDNKTWYNPTAVCVGKAGASHSNLTVRFGDNGSNVAIAIGESTTRWDYPQVVVHDVLLGFNDYSFNSFKSGWSIVFNNQDTPNVSQTISNTHVGYNAITSWDKIQNKPSSFTPASHTHTKDQVGLGNVDNTADADKSVKYATNATNATTATKLSSNAGSNTQPVYFSDGKPVVIGYTIASSVPANAKFTDTTYGVATASSNGLMSSTDKTKLDDFSRVISIQKQIKLTTDWQDTGIAGNNLETGTYIIQVSGFNSSYTSLYNEVYSGIMTWYANETNSDNSSEIFLHNAGHADNSNAIYLRTSRRAYGNGGLHLQIACKVAATGTDTLTFKFRRLI